MLQFLKIDSQIFVFLGKHKKKKKNTKFRYERFLENIKKVLFVFSKTVFQKQYFKTCFKGCGTQHHPFWTQHGFMSPPSRQLSGHFTGHRRWKSEPPKSKKKAFGPTTHLGLFCHLHSGSSPCRFPGCNRLVPVTWA